MSARLLLALGLFSPAALAQTEEGGAPNVEAVSPDAGLPRQLEDLSLDELDDLSLEDMLEGRVVMTGKVAQKVTEVPAVITVIDAEEIASNGYASLAEVVASVPGFFDAFDLVWHNMGIRGVSGGARSAGSAIKLMIDGQAVSYRPSNGNFFGEELIPLSAIDRVEVLRGPASALYGANAFLGVVNVVTRSGRDADGARLVGRVGFNRDRPFGGGELTVGGQSGSIDALVSIGGAVVDRAGLSLPDSSPVLGLRPELRGGTSTSDLSRPKSAVARVSVGKLETGKVTLLGTLQHLDSDARFLDRGTFNPGNRVSVLNQAYRLSYQRAPSEQVNFNLSATWFDSSSTEDSSIDLGFSERVLVPRESARGFELLAEGSFKPAPWLVLTAGLDYSREDHVLLSYADRYTRDVVRDDGTVLYSADTVAPGVGAGRKALFSNFGPFLQAIWQATPALGVTVGTRIDAHNIYGVNVSPRVGLVYAPPKANLSLKLLGGASFKAPTAQQLYTEPTAPFDVVGNPALKAQNAQTVELAARYLLRGRGEINLNAFVTRITGRVDYQQHGLYFSAANSGIEVLSGGELDARIRLFEPLLLKVTGSLALTLSTPPPSSIGASISQSVFPPGQLRASLEYRFPWLGIKVTPEVQWVSPRTSSVANALQNFAPYQLPGYVLVNLAVVTGERRLIARLPTRFAFRVTNLLDTRFVTPAFGGVDLPTLGRTFSLTVTQGF